jgi:hypothetical protein
MPIIHQNKEGKSRKPGTKCIEDILDFTEDPSFISFIEVSIYLKVIVILVIFVMGPEEKNDARVRNQAPMDFRGSPT